MNLQVDLASKDETSIIIELLKKLYLELGEESESVSFLSDKLILAMINSGKTEIYLAKQDNNKIVGIATLTETQAIYAGGNYGLLDEMYVLPEFRSKNIGKNLVQKIISVAREKKWKRIDVTTPTEQRWEKTVKFYQSCGFVFTGQKLKLLM
jgi:GNAT superfamily N-acetyltransferase